MADYSKYINSNSSHKKLGDFVLDQSSYGFGIDLREILDYSVDGIYNYELIYSSVFTYNRELALQYKDTINNYETKTDRELQQIPFPIGCSIYIPFQWVDRSLNATQSTNFIASTDYESFLSKKLYDLLNDKQYRVDLSNRKKTSHTISDIFTNITVWVWSKGLSKKLKQSYAKENSKGAVDSNGDVTITAYAEDEYEDIVVDVTPFIYNLSTNVTETGGNFSFGIAPILAEFKNDKWIVDTKSVKVGKDSYVADTHFHSTDKVNELKRNQIYFNNVFQQNDVVFIRFEKLELEQDRGKDYSFEINKCDLPDKIYDMIGLIDNVNESYNGTNNNLDVNVSGRDLIKLFIEDGVYFYPFQFTNGGIFANTTGANDETLNRFGKGDIRTRYQFFNKTLDSTLKYIINSLSTIKICSDSLFDGYENKRTDAYRVDTKDPVQIEKVIEKDNRRKKIIELIKQARKQDKLDQFQEISEDAVYTSITSFIQDIITKNIQVDTNGDLQGWSDFQYNAELLGKDELSYSLENNLFRPDYKWRLPNGQIVNDSERSAFIDKYQKALDNIIATQTDLLSDLGQTNIDRKIKNQLYKGSEASVAGDRATTDQKRYLELGAYNNDLKANLLEKSSLQTDGIRAAQEASNASTQQIVTQNEELFNLQRSTNVKLTELDEEYNKIKANVGGIALFQIPSYFPTLKNKFAKQAIEETYKLLKDKELNSEDRELLPVRGIWQIIKLVIDDSVANRRVVDSSIGNEHGSLLNAMNKICVKPFAEFYTDTYGDEFHLVIRKQPFDKESIISYLDKRVNYKNDVKVEVDNLHLAQKTKDEEPTSIIIDIEEHDLISSSLAFDNTAYSWYRLQMVNPNGGSSQSMAFAYLKAIYFKEYAEIFGSKPLDQTINYIPYLPLPDKGDKIPNAYFIRQGILDLKYLIESNAYLPFTRKGTITINGNRTIKRGIFIRLKSTNEIFYVNAVSNSYSIDSNSIDRVTTLNVSRGMVEDYIKEGITIGTQKYTYFDICNTTINDKIFNDNELAYSTYSETIAKTWKVNKEVFNFFLKRYQFAPQDQVRGIVENLRSGADTQESFIMDQIV